MKASKMLRECARFALAAGCAVGFWLFFVLLSSVGSSGAALQEGPTIPSKEEFIAAHRYHGVQWSYEEDGTWYFNRDGQQCKLFKYMENR